MAKQPRPAPVKAANMARARKQAPGNLGRGSTEAPIKQRATADKQRANANRAARRAMEQEIDAILERIEVGIAAQSKEMEELLERLSRPATR